MTSGSPHNNSSTLRILAVDDEPMLGELMRRILERKGHAVSVFENPLLALDALRNNPGGFDLLITDQSMPQMPGDMLICEAVKLVPNLKLILASGDTETVDRRLTVETGLHCVLNKPFTPGELDAAVAKAVPEHSAG
jgi:DNA-binding response OmpR family regulator